MQIKAEHHTRLDLTALDWAERWPNFSPAELASRGDGSILIDADALDKLQALRTALGAPLIINSAYRDPDYNELVGGAQKSRHMRGIAFDISLRGHDPMTLLWAAEDAGFTRFGLYAGFLHVDTDMPRASWWCSSNKALAQKVWGDSQKLHEERAA